MITIRPPARVSRRQLIIVLMTAALALVLWAFAQISDQGFQGRIAQIDRAILLAMRNPQDPSDPIGPRALELATRDLTALGSMTVLGILTVVIGGYLIYDGKRRIAFLLWGSVASGWVASVTL